MIISQSRFSSRSHHQKSRWSGTPPPYSSSPPEMESQNEWIAAGVVFFYIEKHTFWGFKNNIIWNHIITPLVYPHLHRQKFGTFQNHHLGPDSPWPVISPIALLWILLSSLPASKLTKPRPSSLWSWKTMIVCIGENGLVALLGSSFFFMPSKILSSKEFLNKTFSIKKNTHREKHTSRPIRSTRAPKLNMIFLIFSYCHALSMSVRTVRKQFDTVHESRL